MVSVIMLEHIASMCIVHGYFFTSAKAAFNEKLQFLQQNHRKHYLSKDVIFVKLINYLPLLI